MSHAKFTTEELEAKASQIMYSFNFEKVHENMVASNHQWFIGDGMKVPDLDELRSTARSLLVKAIYDKEPVSNVGTGGFVAYKLPWGLQLTFQLAWA